MTVTVDAREEVAREGFKVVDLLDAPAVAAVQRIVEDAALDREHEFYASPAMSWGPAARSIDQRLKQLVAPFAAALLPGYRAFMAGITSKGAHSQRSILFHQDWTYTDESQSPVVFLWCPLVDVDERNGGLSVVPRSHRWTRDLRPSRELEASEGLQEQLQARSVRVPLRSGQAIAFDPATFHGSGPNHSCRVRPAFTMAFAPEGAELVHFHEDPGGNLSGYVVDDAFFTEHPYRSRPTDYPMIDPPSQALSAATLARVLESPSFE